MNFKQVLGSLIADETGSEVLEYTIIAGLATVSAVGLIAKFGTKVLARWTSLNNQI